NHRGQAAATTRAHRTAPRPAAPSPPAGLRSRPAAAAATRLSTRLDPMPPVRRSHRHVGGESPPGDDGHDSAGEHDTEQPGQLAGLLGAAAEPAPEVGGQVAPASKLIQACTNDAGDSRPMLAMPATR